MNSTKQDSTPITIMLETLNSPTAAVTLDANSKPVMWLYNPKNRIFTPTIMSYPDLASMLADLCSFLVNTYPDDPKMEDQLRRALELSIIHRLEFKALALSEGGYITADPAETKVQLTDGPGIRRLLPDYARGIEYRKKAADLRKCYDATGSGKDDATAGVKDVS